MSRIADGEQLGAWRILRLGVGYSPELAEGLGVTVVLAVIAAAYSAKEKGLNPVSLAKTAAISDDFSAVHSGGGPMTITGTFARMISMIR